MKLGDHTVLAETPVDDWGNRDPDTGNPAKTYVYTSMQWCSFTPARSSEDQSRTSPAISGANLLAPPEHASTITAATAFLYPFSEQLGPDGRRLGTRWELVGEVGIWDEAVECQLRRLT